MLGVFSVALPSLWNSLPEYVTSSNSIVSFRHHFKTHIFKLAYPSYVSEVSTASDELMMNFTSYHDYEIAHFLYYRRATELDSFSEMLAL